MNKLKQLGSWLWWRAALIRAGRTAIVVALPYFGAVLIADVPWLVLASTVGFGAVSSLITSVAGIAETEGSQVSWWYAVAERVVKSFAQGLATGLGTATMFQQVEWSMILQSSVLAAVGSALLAFLTKLPEAEQLPSPVQPVASVDNITLTESSSGTSITSTDVVVPDAADSVHVGTGPA